MSFPAGFTSNRGQPGSCAHAPEPAVKINPSTATPSFVYRIADSSYSLYLARSALFIPSGRIDSWSSVAGDLNPAATHLKTKFHSDDGALLRQIEADPVRTSIDVQARSKLVTSVRAYVFVNGYPKVAGSRDKVPVAKKVHSVEISLEEHPRGISQVQSELRARDRNWGQQRSFPANGLLNPVDYTSCVYARRGIEKVYLD